MAVQGVGRGAVGNMNRQNPAHQAPERAGIQKRLGNMPTERFTNPGQLLAGLLDLFLEMVVQKTERQIPGRAISPSTKALKLLVGCGGAVGFHCSVNCTLVAGRYAG